MRVQDGEHMRNKEKIKKKKKQRARKQGRQKRLVSELEELYSNMLIS